MQKLVKEKKDLGLDPKKSNPETKDIITPFQKKISCWLSSNKRTTKKNEEIEF